MRLFVKRPKMQSLSRQRSINRYWPTWAVVKQRNNENHAIKMVWVASALQAVQVQIDMVAAQEHHLLRLVIEQNHQRFRCHRHPFHLLVLPECKCKRIANVWQRIPWAATLITSLEMHCLKHHRQAINAKDVAIKRDELHQCQHSMNTIIEVRMT